MARTCNPTVNACATALGLLLCGGPLQAEPGKDNRAPDVPEVLQVPDGHKVHFHVYAAGVQIYQATPSETSATGYAWRFIGPLAILYDSDENEVGVHYTYGYTDAGSPIPAWESQSGSLVVGSVVPPPPRVAVSNAIPWLRLTAALTEGPGIFERTTYIQRVNTTGGLAPAALPTQAGEEARVPYTTEYYFYREWK
jgi:hypothetical protein